MFQSSHSLSKGIAYLTLVHTKELPTIDQCFFVVAVQGIPGLDGQRQKVMTAIKKNMTRDWLKTAPLDEVFTVVNTVHHDSPQSIGGEQLAILVTRLLDAEQAVGGPYSDTQDIDLYTNAAINSFATWAAGPLPNVSDYIDAQQRKGHTTLKFERYQDLCNTKNPSRQIIAQAIKTQLKNGSWDNDVVTSAITIQKLALSQGKVAANAKHYAASNAAIFSMARHDSTSYSPPMQAAMQTMLSKLERANKHFEITLLATYFAEALGEQAPDKMLHELGLANLYGWLAYTLYDNILDQEDAGAAHLSLANIGLRQSYLHYLETGMAHLKIINTAFDRVDEANAWELANARAAIAGDTIAIPRLPQYGNRMQLAYRSFIHVLGPRLLAAEAGLSQKQQQKVQLAWQHYLIGRQLNDDLHDWQQDLQAGQLTYVVTALLRDCAIKPGTYSLTDLTTQLQQRFITQTVERLCPIITAHIERATAAFAAGGVSLSGTEIKKLFTIIRSTASQTQSLQQDSLAFQKHFRSG